MYDLIIIGGGPGGVAAGVYAARKKMKTLLITDTFGYCAERLPNWNSISISGYHIREAGSTALQELAFTIYDGVEYVEGGVEEKASAVRTHPL